MPTARVLVLAGSIRSGAFSGKLAALAAKELALNDADVTRISLADYPLQIYDSDLERDKGVPENAKKLARQIAAHQGVFIATPEYNNTVPPLLTNTIAWIGRIRNDEIAFRHRVCGLGSTAPGPVGGARALIDLRKIATSGLGAIIIPEKIEIGGADEAFDESGNLANAESSNSLKVLCKRLVEFASRLAD